MNPLVAELFVLCTCGHPLVNHLIGRCGVTIWVVVMGEDRSLITLYDNESAAMAHCEFWDGMVLGGYAKMLAVERWSVQTEFRGEVLS